MVRWPNPKTLSLSRIKAARLAAVRARHIAQPADKKRTAWEVAELYWNRFATLARTGVAVLVAGFALYILWQSIFQKIISIAPISVPKNLADGGYTSDVAAERLQSVLNDIVARAHSMRGGPEVASQSDLPSIVVPSTALSTEAIAAQIRRFLDVNSRWNVSGEITVVDKKLWVRLRMNGRNLYASAAGGDPEHPDDPFAQAAQKIFEDADPYILAASQRESDPSKSLELAKRIISDRPKTDPSVSWAHNLIGGILLDQGQTDDAIHEYQIALELDPYSAVYHNNLGYALTIQHMINEGMREFSKAVDLDPHLMSAHVALCSYLRNQQNQRMLTKAATECYIAMAECHKLIERSPSAGFPHAQLGLLLGKELETDKAITEFRRAIFLDPGNAVTHVRFGIALGKGGINDEEVAEMRKAIELAPRLMTAHYHLAVILGKLEQPDEAITELHKAIELAPSSPLPHVAMSEIVGRQHNVDEAITELRSAINLAPHDADLHLLLGHAMYDKHESDEAIAEFRNAIKLAPHYAHPHNDLGFALREQRKTEEAVAEFKKAIDLDPRGAYPHNNLGNVLSDKGKTDEAITEYKKAIDLDPRWAIPHRNLGIALRQQGKNGDGDAELKKALDLEQKH
jgi:tetratricopeptide (TPR) repeat protein